MIILIRIELKGTVLLLFDEELNCMKHEMESFSEMATQSWKREKRYFSLGTFLKHNFFLIDSRKQILVLLVKWHGNEPMQTVILSKNAF